jgi:PEGA domain
MKRPVLLFCLLLCLLVTLLPVAYAIGGSEGWIQIQCNVNGASVSFDGEYKGITSGGSLSVPVYTTGTPYHSFRVEKAGYTTFEGSLSMPAEGKTNTYYATLNPVYTPTTEPPVRYGTIYVESSPAGADIYFNGNYRGHAPLTISDVWPGTYTISAEMNGYRTYTTTTSVSGGTRSSVYCPLTPENTNGALYVMSSPSNANVYLDGLYKGITPLTLSNLAAGTHILQIDHANNYDWKSTVDVPEGGTRTISATLNPMPASSTGWVYVSSSPGGAVVTLDGNSVGQTPVSGSLKLNTVTAGDHTVALSLSGYQPYSSPVTVSPNTVSEVSAVLIPTGTSSGKGSMSVSSNPPGANIFADNNFIGISPLTAQDIAAGNHMVTFRLEGYQEYSTSALVNAGTTSTVSAALLPVTPTPKSPLSVSPVILAVMIMALVFCRRNR